MNIPVKVRVVIDDEIVKKLMIDLDWSEGRVMSAIEMLILRQTPDTSEIEEDIRDLGIIRGRMEQVAATRREKENALRLRAEVRARSDRERELTRIRRDRDREESRRLREESERRKVEEREEKRRLREADAEAHRLSERMSRLY